VCVSSYFFAFIREFNILCFDSILNGGYVLFKAVLISGKTTTDLLKFQFDNNDIGTLATTNSHTGNYVNTNSNNRVINPIISENNKTFAQENKSRLDKLTKHVRNDYDKFEYNVRFIIFFCLYKGI
jgi:intergrase/recombinase